MKLTRPTALAFSLAAVTSLAGLAASRGSAPAQEQDAMAKAGTPGAMHAQLEPMIGTWKADCSFWMMAGAPPMQVVGESVNTWVLGKRFMKQHFTGEMMGDAFEGIGYLGYSNLEETYQSTWMDSMNTRIAYGESKYDKEKKAVIGEGEEPNPMTGGITKFRDVTTIQGPDKHTFVRFNLSDEGEWKSMEIVYTRKSS